MFSKLKIDTWIAWFLVLILICLLDFLVLQVVLKGDARKLNLHGQTCAVCLEDFKVKDELGVLPCQHAFHRKCLVKWLEVRCVCPMCNKPIAGPTEPHQGIGTLLDELV
uniref:RING finger protein 122 n=1 Tax=Sphenodon punctatus TaxID=8508 RepID=A0A8D0GX77_SPHPU